MATPPSPAARPSESDPDDRSGPVAAVESAVERAAARATRHSATLWRVAAVALLADVLLTAYGLRNGYVEANPIAAAMFRQVGVPATFVGLKGFPLAVAAVGRAALPRAYRGVAPLCLALPWTAATVINLVVLFG